MSKRAKEGSIEGAKEKLGYRGPDGPIKIRLMWRRVVAWACMTYQCGYVHFPTENDPLPDECPNCGAIYPDNKNVR